MANIYDDVELLQQQIATLIPQALTEGTDLFTLGVGRYYIPSIAVSATLLNKPTSRTSNAYIDVRPGAANGELQMWYYINTKSADANAEIYYNYFYDGSWGNWNTGYLRDPNDDSGWLDLQLASNITEHNTTNFPCRYRKIGNVVFVEGAVTGIGTSSGIFATLPAGFRPSKPFYYLQACSGNKINTLKITSAGTIERVGTTSGTLLTSDYHFINTSFAIN